jgi:hypothetical protein
MNVGSPRQLLTLREAALMYAHDFLHVVEVGGDNLGPAVQFFQRAARIDPGSPWCAAFVNACAEIAAAVINKMHSPLEQVRRQGFVADYYEWAEQNDLLIPFEKIVPGDLFLLWFESKDRHAHIGFVDTVHLNSDRYITIEGNTDDEASREGIKVAKRDRKPGKGDVFVRWAA